jgi:hypothetical protein
MDTSQVSYAVARQARLNKEQQDKNEAALKPSGDPEMEIKPGRGSEQLGAGSRK